MASSTKTPCVSIILEGAPGAGARHALAKVEQALQTRGIVFEELTPGKSARGDTLLVIATHPAPLAASLLASLNSAGPQGAESILIRHGQLDGKPAWLVMGGDDRGLMYGLLDIADRIPWAEDPAQPLSEVREVSESPAVAERSLSIYTMQKEQFESRLVNEGYWARYLDLLARSRFNTFTLIFGYETAGYMAPPYPYFFDVEGFPQVHAVGYPPEVQARNLAALNRLIAMVHERGLDFTLAIWDHIYRGGVQGGPTFDPDVALPYRVMGVTEENLYDYTVAALKTLFGLVPNIDRIQFRMHEESGLKGSEMDAFWDRVFDVVKQEGGNILFDARAKGFPDRLIDLAVQKGVNMRISTKYWMEQMGLPFHPTHVHPQNQMDRRHGYADLLRYPQRYHMFWRLWNGGTTRILLWGDPEYVRRFAESTHLCDGDGFDVNEPLATKMASHNHDRTPYELLQPAYRYYDWEFERYWHFFQVFGRVGYNPDTPPEIWEREFDRRFGKDAGPHVRRGLHLASRILPKIVAYNYPYDLFPTTRGWVEKQPMKTLPDYAAALPSDTEQFLSMDDEAACRMDGTDSAKVRPEASSLWFTRAAADVMAEVNEAEQLIGPHRTREFDSTMVDLRILSYLASYHARRALAGVSYALWKRSNDLNALDDAICYEGEAIAIWEQIVATGKDVYARNFMMGREHVGLAGNWESELLSLRNGMVDLQKEREAFHPEVSDGAPCIAHVPVRRAVPGNELTMRATIAASAPIAQASLHYLSEQGAERVVEMEQSGPYTFQAKIAASAVREGLCYAIDAVNAQGLRASVPAEGWAAPIAVIVTRDDAAPTVSHNRVTEAPVGQPITITARVSDPSGVKRARVAYRNVNQYQDFQRLEMTPTSNPDEYQANIPGDAIDPQWDLMYFLEAVDQCGNGRIYPDLEEETPYFIVKLVRS